MILTPERALILLAGPAGPERDQLRLAWLKAQTSEDLMHWLGTCVQAFIARHPQHGKQLQILVAELIQEATVRRQASTS